MSFAGDTCRIVAAKTKMSEQPLAHTSQMGLQQVNNLLILYLLLLTQTCSWTRPSQN